MKTFLAIFATIALGIGSGAADVSTGDRQPPRLTAGHASTAPAPSNQAVSASTVLPAGDALPDTLSMVTRMGLSVLAVIALLWGVVQILKKFSPGGVGSAGTGNIRVLDRAYIAPKKSIVVVQVGSKALALGVSDQQMTNLADLDLEETLAQYDTPRVNGTATQRFTDVLKSVNARFVRQTEEPAT